jgi:hypothetical protein
VRAIRVFLLQSAKGELMAIDETERYRRAAEDALQQLDWCIGYLHGIRKQEISRQLAKNRRYIRQRLLQQAAEPMPAEATSEA